VQNQQKLEWPRKLVVAKAYVDQLERSHALPADQIASLRSAIEKAESSSLNKSSLEKLKGMTPSLEKSAASASEADARRLNGLAEILKHPSK